MSALSSVAGTSSALASTAASAATGSTGNSATGTLSVGGLVSGLNTSQIIQGLLAVQQAQITQVQGQDAAVTQKQTAYKALQAQLLSFQSSVNQLAQSVNGPLDGRTATSSDTTAVTAAASSTAVPGVYTFTVNALAQANQVASQGYASATSQIAQGQYTIASGSTSANVTIASGNDTLQGLAAAINSAGAGVTAAVVNDGSSTPYRLLLTANQTGTANVVTVTPPSGGDATTPTFTTTQAAANATITLGSTTGGGSGLTVSSSSNTLSSVISGVTLNLLATTASNAPVQLTVANDSATAQTAIQGFVTAYNSLQSAISSDVSYDAQTKTAGVLLGDATVFNIENQLSQLVVSPVAGANAKLSSLSALGITINASGQLQVNSTTLNNVLSGQVSGVTLNDVRNLFTVGAQSTNAGVTFVGAGSATKASATPYGVTITQAPQQAVLTGDTALGPNTAIASTGNTFTITVNGVTSNTLTIPASTGSGYTPQALVEAVQAQIDADSKIGSQGVVVGIVNNQLTFTSQAYGSASSLSIGSSDFLGFSSAQSANGQDVIGSYLVNGKAEAATGNGRLLTGNSSNANTAGLAVEVTLLPSQLGTVNTPVANLTVTQGVAAQLSTALNTLLDPATGQLQTIDQNFQQQDAAYQTQIKQLQQQYNAQQAQLTTQFSNLEATLSQLKNASNLISQQTAAIASITGTTSATSSSVGTFSGSSTSGH